MTMMHASPFSLPLLNHSPVKKTKTVQLGVQQLKSNSNRNVCWDNVDLFNAPQERETNGNNLFAHLLETSPPQTPSSYVSSPKQATRRVPSFGSPTSVVSTGKISPSFGSPTSVMIMIHSRTSNTGGFSKNNNINRKTSSRTRVPSCVASNRKKRPSTSAFVRIPNVSSTVGGFAKSNNNASWDRTPTSSASTKNIVISDSLKSTLLLSLRSPSSSSGGRTSLSRHRFSRSSRK